MRQFHQQWLLFGCLLLGASVVAAQGTTPKQAANNALDQQIQSYLQKEYSQNSQLKGLHVSVNDRVATLSGSVSNLRAKLNAEQDARQVQSVDGVVNRIAVNTPTVPDQQLHKEIADRLVYDRLGMGQTFNSLNLKVNHGIVSVGGSVIDYPSRDSAVDIIVGTKGVKGVVDNIHVDPPSPMDDQIRLEAARAIYGNPQFMQYRNDPAHPIRIVVTNGHVTLTGVVNSKVDKAMAANAVRSIPGVFSVKNDLVISSNG
ncbi:MAG: BON domain-containing protein [Terriglobales bacterium]